MLLGRTAECERIAALLAGGRRGLSAALVLEGDPGIGKSALLRWAVSAAGDAQVLEVRGLESETALTYSGLADLLRPVLGHLGDLPPVQAAALRGALALGPPAAADRFTVSLAVLGLLAAAAACRPVLVVVDDAHWLDAASAQVLAFAARRLGAEGVVVLLAVRAGEAGAAGAGLPRLHVGGLDRGAALALLDRGPALAAGVGPTLVDSVGGNPLALREIPRLLDADQRAGRAALEDPLPVGERLARAYAGRVGALPPPARTALLVAAANDTADVAEVVAAAGALGVGGAALEQAADAGLVRLAAGEVEFEHPLLRAAVYHGAARADRRAAHGALAGVLSGRDAEDRRAWHRAAATLVPDERVAAELERAGRRARDRGGHAVAVRALARAAGLTADRATRARRYVAAAQTAQLAGDAGTATRLLERALPDVEEPRLRADAQHLHGVVRMWAGDLAGARELLVREQEAIAATDPDKATAMLVDAAATCVMAGDVTAALATARRATEVGERAGPRARLLATGALGEALILSGRALEGYPLVLEALDVLERERFAAPDTILQTPRFLQCSSFVEDHARAQRLLDGRIATARANSAPGMSLPFHLALRAELGFRTGRWAQATADGTEALELARQTGQRSAVSFCLVTLARLHAARGEGDECRALTEEAFALAHRHGLGSIPCYAESVLGLLELGLGRTGAALAHLEVLAELLERRGVGEPGVIPWHHDLVEALVRARRHDDARAALAAFARQATATQRGWALATAARCRGLLAPDDGVEAAFDDALALHRRRPSPFEEARTLLCLGERRRGAGRDSAARPPLRTALAVFEDLGARPWAERAHAELAAAGRPEPRAGVPGLDRLTPAELQVATVVATGASNRETATSLFITTKTVEFHLSSVYRKLGVRSRAGLAHLLAGGSRPA